MIMIAISVVIRIVPHVMEVVANVFHTFMGCWVVAYSPFSFLSPMFETRIRVGFGLVEIRVRVGLGWGGGGGLG